MNNNFNMLVEILLDEDDESLGEFLLQESEKDDIMVSLDGNSTLMNYMMLFEEFLEQHDLYLFQGWEKAEFVTQPSVEKFWVVFHLVVGEETDLRGAKRVNDAMTQGEVVFQKQDDGKILVRFTVLKRALDQIEKDTRDRIEKLSDDAAEDVQ
jgi:hypothetical protein